MDIQDLKGLLKLYITELKCELTGWDKSIPIESVKSWVKKVETRIIRKIDDKHD